jgi:hypothetical protein
VPQGELGINGVEAKGSVTKEFIWKSCAPFYINNISNIGFIYYPVINFLLNQIISLRRRNQMNSKRKQESPCSAVVTKFGKLMRSKQNE